MAKVRIVEKERANESLPILSFVVFIMLETVIVGLFIRLIFSTGGVDDTKVMGNLMILALISLVIVLIYLQKYFLPHEITRKVT